MRTFRIPSFQPAGGTLVAMNFEIIADLGLAPNRFEFDEPVIDCSRRVFMLTNAMICKPQIPSLVCFPSRRWRNFRTLNDIDLPIPFLDGKEPLDLIYIGNPIRIFNSESGITVERSPEFLIKSGTQLQAEAEYAQD